MAVPLLGLGPAVPLPEFQMIRNRMALDFCKWDSQVGDVTTLFRQPLLLCSETWQQLQQSAETLSSELLCAERELLDRPEPCSALGLPLSLRKIFEDANRGKESPCAVRTLRFDFHYTLDGWRISEVNSDVPGGYTEGSRVAELMCGVSNDVQSAGDPGAQWANAMLSGLEPSANVALLSAPGFLEDQQITAFLAFLLHQGGVRTFLL